LVSRVEGLVLRADATLAMLLTTNMQSYWYWIFGDVKYESALHAVARPVLASTQASWK